MANRFTFHVLGLPHTSIEPSYVCCAYSMKLLKFAKMATAHGHVVVMYSNEGAEVPCENVQALTEIERASWFGPHDPQKLYDLRWDPNEPYWRLFNERCTEALKLRVKKGDFILTCSGNCSQPIADAFPGSYSGIQQSAAFVEAFIGYYGTFSRYRVFESHAHREWMMGARGHKVEDNDTAVVENYWDLHDFEVKEISPRAQAVIDAGPYWFFIGRVIHDKGFDIAIDACKTIGGRLVIAGQGAPGVLPPNVTFYGQANVADRAALLTNSIGAFCPTRFREPFGGTAVEAQLCGTPAITTDQGAFTQTVASEWRCASHREFCDAAMRAAALTIEQRAAIKASASALYSLEAIWPKYQRYFQRLTDRWGAGWYQEIPIDPSELP
jgi:glycosyltransferase involved in cell wall biosynthesis